MIKEIRFQNWKSFAKATLYIDPFTVLIGTNASGKSNILDALLFLQRIANGLDVQTALGGNEVLPALRGGFRGAAYQQADAFKISILIDIESQFKLSTQSILELEYELLVTLNETIPRMTLNTYSNYQLSRDVCDFLGISNKEYEYEVTLSVISKVPKKAANGKSSLEGKGYLPYHASSDLNLIRQIKTNPLFKHNNIYIFEVKPDKIRNYSRYSKNLLPDVSNLAGFIAALSTETKQTLEHTLTEYLSRLPQKDIKKVWAEPVGRLGNDAMLYCEEEWIDGHSQIIDAQGMSDGTLRFIAILTVLLTCPERSLIAIEEVDTGLHPSRMHLLIEAIQTIGQDRNVDVLVTTHNPALLDGLPPDMMPFVQVVHRDQTTGASVITPLDDIKQLPKLLASGSLGKVTTRGELEQSLQTQG